MEPVPVDSARNNTDVFLVSRSKKLQKWYGREIVSFLPIL